MAADADTGEDSTDGPGTVCSPGQQIDCACPGGIPGAQACAADGSAFLPCSCPGSTATDDGDTTDGDTTDGDTTDGDTTNNVDDSTGADTSTDGSTGDTDSSSTGTGGTDDCDPFTQDCRTGMTCHPFASVGLEGFDDLACFPIDATPVQEGDSCSVSAGRFGGVDNCGLGLVCFYVDSGGFGRCMAQCEGSLDNPICGNPDDICANISDNELINLCLPSCSPLLQDCTNESACYNFGEEFVCLPDNSDGGGGPTDPCSGVSDCESGTTCLSPPTTACTDQDCCVPFCDLSAPSCGAGTSCTPWYDDPMMAPAEWMDVGVCLPS